MPSLQLVPARLIKAILLFKHKVIDNDGNLIYKVDAPSNVKTVPTVQDGFAGADGVSTDRVQQNAGDANSALPELAVSGTENAENNDGGSHKGEAVSQLDTGAESASEEEARGKNAGGLVPSDQNYVIPEDAGFGQGIADSVRRRFGDDAKERSAATGS